MHATKLTCRDKHRGGWLAWRFGSGYSKESLRIKSVTLRMAMQQPVECGLVWQQLYSISFLNFFSYSQVHIHQLAGSSSYSLPYSLDLHLGSDLVRDERSEVHATTPGKFRFSIRMWSAPSLNRESRKKRAVLYRDLEGINIH